MANCPTGSDPREWVEYYVNELGWSLIPVNDKKIPIKQGWNEYRNNPMSVDMLMWYVGQGYGLGAITGDKLFYAIDDDYPKHPESTQPGWYDGFESSVVCKTQNGGRHYYFKPFNMPNKQNIKLENGDTLQVDLRGSNGQVLVPPFFGYSWEKPPTKDAYDNLPTIKDLPLELVSAFKKGKELNTSYIGHSDFFDVLGRSTHRDPILFERSFVLWQNHIKKPEHYTPEYIASMLSEFNQQFNPPKSESVVAKCYEQGRQYALSMAKTEGEISVQDPEVFDINSIESIDQLEIKNYPKIDLGLYKFAEGIPSGMNLIIGLPGSGKSWFSIWMMKKIYEKHQYKSVFFSLEMDTNGLTKRIIQSYSNRTLEQFENREGISEGLRKAKEVGFTIVDYSQMDSSGITPTQFSNDIHKFYQAGYRVFFLDHLHEIPGATTSQKNSEVVEVWGDVFKHIRNTYEDVWLFILVQPNKEAYKRKTLTKETTSGSTNIINKCDFFLSLNREVDADKDDDTTELTNKPIRVWVDKNRRGAMDKVGQRVWLTPTGNFIEEDSVFVPELPEDIKQALL